MACQIEVISELHPSLAALIAATFIFFIFIMELNARLASSATIFPTGFPYIFDNGVPVFACFFLIYSTVSTSPAFPVGNQLVHYVQGRLNYRDMSPHKNGQLVQHLYRT